MTVSFLFWLSMFLWFLGGVAIIVRPAAGDARYTFIGGSLLVFILFLLIGLKLFGFPIRG